MIKPLTEIQLRHLECLSDRVLLRDSWVPEGIDVYSQFEYKEFKMNITDSGAIHLITQVGKISSNFLYTTREFEIGSRGAITLLNGRNEVRKSRVCKKVRGFEEAIASRVI